MFKFLILFVLMAIVVARRQRPLVYSPLPPKHNNKDQNIKNSNAKFKLCTYSDIAFKKCQNTVQVAELNSDALKLDCVHRKDRNSCIQSVQAGTSDMVVLTGHGYKEARSSGLQPYIYAKEDDSSLYIAVVPRNITLLDLQEAPIYFDQLQHRAFHAATFFNLRMGHDICAFLNKVSLDSYIVIVDSKDYEPKSDELLICPDRLPDEFENYKTCNVEAGLQRAVFIKTNLSDKQKQDVRQVFDTILQNYGNSIDKTGSYRFFETFQGQDDVIFKKNTISFDLEPTYRNGVDETVFDQFHCNNDELPHDNRYLL